MLKIFRCIDELITLKRASEKKARHIQVKDLSPLSKAAFISYKGNIVWVGKDQDLKPSLLKPYRQKAKEYVLEGFSVLPGFVESHTHLLFAGNRQDEFEKRTQGFSYEEIAKKGGGILSTMRATRKASLKELIRKGQIYTDRFVAQGTSTLEIKTGYALNLNGELKMLKAIKSLKGPRKITTLLALHALPPEFSSSHHYTRFVIEKLLPKVIHLIDRVDIFIERSYFDCQDAEEFFKACKKLNLKLTAHTEQMSLTKGYESALRHKAHSVDHLICLDKKGITKIAKSSTTATLLPVCDFYLKCSYPPARQLLDQGARVALATDFNPGSSPSQNLCFAGVLARLEMKMNLAEVLVAYTLAGAYALGLETQIGSLEPKKSADFLVLKGSYKELFYSIGHHPISQVFCKGKKIFSQKGQIAIEYVLMLLILASLAFLIINLTVSEEGFMTKKWIEVIDFIGKDSVDDLEF